MSRLKRQFIWLVLARTCYTLCQWLMLTSVVRMTDTATVGVYGTALAITTMVFRFTEFGMDLGVTTDIAREYTDNDYRRLRIRLHLLSVVIVLVISTAIYRLDQVGIICIVLLGSKIVESQTILSYGMLRREGRSDVIARSLIARGIVGSLTFATLLYQTGSLAISLGALALAWLLVGLVFENVSPGRNSVALRSENESSPFRKTVNASPLKDLAWRLLPLGIGGLLAYMLGAMPTVLLKSLTPIELAGIYTALYYPLHAGNMIIKSIGEVLLKPLAEAHRENKAQLANRILTRAIVLISGICFAGVGVVHFFGEQFLGLVYTSDYKQYATQFTFLAIAWTFRYLGSTIKLIPDARRDFRSSLSIHLIAVAPMVLLAPFTIFYYGLNGAIFAVFISHLLFLGASSSAAIAGQRTDDIRKSG